MTFEDGRAPLDHGEELQMRVALTTMDQEGLWLGFSADGGAAAAWWAGMERGDLRKRDLQLILHKIEARRGRPREEWQA